jgi:hypothetical protein
MRVLVAAGAFLNAQRNPERIERLKMKATHSRLTIIVAVATALFGPRYGLTVAKAEKGVAMNRSISFSGYAWKVKSSEGRVGPGSNFFSDSEDNVQVDDAGRLHLRISRRDEHWQCAEVISQNSFGFGTYRFCLATPLAKLDPNLTLGLFTWSDAPAYAHREIDIECGKWGRADDTNNAQFVVQPYQPAGRLSRYRVSDNVEDATHSFLWQTDNVFFWCLAGPGPAAANRATMIREWRFNGGRVPQPGDENVRMNLWLSVGQAPLDASNTEIVIAKFEFLPPAAAARSTGRGEQPGVTIAEVPSAALKPGPDGTAAITGKATGINPSECRIVIYARGDRWYVQPRADEPYTTIHPDGTWETGTHGGSEYAALLIKPSFRPPAVVLTLPALGTDVIALARALPDR